MSNEYKQITIFEEDYIQRTTGTVTQKPDNALTELIANSWDAGAKLVEITIPLKEHEKLIIQDDGIGMSEAEFSQRWLTLSYNRVKNQGIDVEFPPEVKDIKRKAYGRNGIGRHSMFCFSTSYHIDTWKNGECFSCDVDLSSGSTPFKIYNVKKTKKEGHGTKLSTFVTQNLPDVKTITDVLSARYLFDPSFIVKINNVIIDLSNHSGLQKQEEIVLSNGIKLKIYIIDSNKTAKKSVYHGIAFWVGKRLVGEPSWELGDRMIRDGRTQMAKRYTVIVQTDDMYDDVLPDWTAFKKNDRTKELFEKVAIYVNNYIREISKEKRQETKLEIVRNRINEIKELNKSSQSEVAEFIDNIVEEQPDLSIETVDLAVETMINIQKARTGQDLLEKLSKFSEDDIETLNNILESWNVKDIQLTLDTIDKRVLVVEAIERLCSDRHTDELHTLHPLVAQAKWLFGPEYDSEMYTYNKRLSTIVKEVFKSIKYKELEEPNKRPDLVIFEESVIAPYGFEDWNDEISLNEYRKILIIELKKGFFTIEQNEINQAMTYVNALYNSSSLPSKPTIYAYVVGDKVSNNISRNVKMDETKQICACTYLELVSTAKKRLFKLRETLNERYEKMSTESIVDKVLKEPKQLEITKNNLKERD